MRQKLDKPDQIALHHSTTLTPADTTRRRNLGVIRPDQIVEERA